MALEKAADLMGEHQINRFVNALDNGDEGPTCQNAHSTCSEQGYFRFKDAMTDFQLHHINQS